MQRWITEGILSDEGGLDQLSFNMPSRRDHLDAMQHYQSMMDYHREGRNKLNIEMAEELLKDLSMDELEASYGNKGPGLYKRIKPMLDRNQEWLDKGRMRFTDGNEVLGHVFAASGLRTVAYSEAPESPHFSRTMAQDWALIEVLPARTPVENKVSIASLDWMDLTLTRARLTAT